MTASATINIACSGLSRVGLVRQDNQDAIRVCDPSRDPVNTHGYLYALADGMGGYEHGDIASQLALKTLFDTYYSDHPSRPARDLRNSVDQANLNVVEEAHRLQARMGTTLTAVSFLGDRVYIAHVGDSRAYLIRNGRARCLTNDHTPVGDLVRMRLLPPQKVRTHKQRSVLNRCLGLTMFVRPDVSRARIQQDDIVVLCSDGVWSVVEDEEFAHLAQVSADPQTLSQALIALATERRSDDDVSVVAIHVCGPVQRVRQRRSGFMNRFSPSWGRHILHQTEDD